MARTPFAIDVPLHADSGLNILTQRCLRGAFLSVADLQAAINRFLDEHNLQSKPFVWTKDPGQIIAAVRRGRQVLDSIR
jgi:hypothetical protein